MRTAFPYWQSRLAPVFDTARQILLTDSDSEVITHQWQEVLPGHEPALKILRLVEMEVDTLICGAISRPLRQMAAAHGIIVIPFVAGELGDILRSWTAGRLEAETFAMPGCGKDRRRRLRGRMTDGGHPGSAGAGEPATARGGRRRFCGEWTGGHPARPERPDNGAD